MRYFLFILFLSATCVAQSSNISVISAEKLNIVYRGIANPIKIAVPGAKSFTATAQGLQKVDDKGNYILTPGAGNDVKVVIEAVMEDGTTVIEEKGFRIKGVPAPVGMLDDIYGGGKLLVSKKFLKDATVGRGVEDFLFDIKFTIVSFTINFPEKKKMQPIDVVGNKMDDNARKAIDKLKPGDIIIINNLRSEHSDDFCFLKENPIAIEIIKD